MSTEQTLFQFLTARYRALIDDERRVRLQFEEQMQCIEKEKMQIKNAAFAAGIDIGVDRETDLDEIKSEAKSEDRNNAQAVRSFRNITIKEAVLKVLKKHRNGLTALDLLPKVNELTGVNYERTSLSPQLSRLLHEGKLIRRKNIWILSNEGCDLTDLLD